jgi:predicted Zn-dependent protease
VTTEIAETKGNLAAALARARQLLAGNPRGAIEQAREILKIIPDQPQASLILGAALRRDGKLPDALTELEALTQRQPKAAQAWLELGLVRAALGKTKNAIAALTEALRLNPDRAEAWQALAEQYGLAGSEAAQNAAIAQQIRHATKDPVLLEAATALCDNKLAIAERVLKNFLRPSPTNVAAIRMLAEVAARLGRYGDAELVLAARARARLTVARQNTRRSACQNKSQEAIASRHAPARRAETSPLMRLERRGIRTNRRVRQSDRVLSGRPEAIPQSTESLDELWSRAEGHRPTGRLHRCI